MVPRNSEWYKPGGRSARSMGPWSGALRGLAHRKRERCRGLVFQYNSSSAGCGHGHGGVDLQAFGLTDQNAKPIQMPTRVIGKSSLLMSAQAEVSFAPATNPSRVLPRKEIRTSASSADSSMFFLIFW